MAKITQPTFWVGQYYAIYCKIVFSKIIYAITYIFNKNILFSIKQIQYQQQQQQQLQQQQLQKQQVVAQQQQQFPNPLINAVRRNDVDLIKHLLSNGADAKATNNYGETALMLTARNGDNKMVQILLPKSDAKAVSNFGYTALMLAAKYGNVKMVERLLPKSDPKATNWRKETAYDLAKKYQRNQIVRLLQQYQVSLISKP